MAPSRKHKISADINAGAWTDLVITCPTPDFHIHGGLVCRTQEFQVHRGVVCSKSTFFAGACAAAPKSDLGHMVVVVDEEKAILELILQYIYTGTFEHGGGIHGDDDLDFSALFRDKDFALPKGIMRLRKHVQLYKAATKYGIADLKACIQKLFDDSFAYVVLHEITSFTADVSNMIEDIYSDAGITDLRDLMVSSIDRQLKKFEYGDSRDSFRWILEENPKLATDLVFKSMLRST